MKSSATKSRGRWIALGALVLAAVGGGAGVLTLMGAARSDFDGDRAFAVLKRQCDFGPRPVGALAHEKTRAYLIEALQAVTDKAATQDFNWSKRGKNYRLTNIMGVINPDAKQKVMLAAHWDTRPTSDKDPDSANRQKPILGANDGASGVAVLLELARALKAKRPQVGVIFMLFDGEDLGPDTGNMFLGAKYFAKNMGAYRPDKMILIDMIGDANLTIYKEMYSLNSDRNLVQTVWDTAGRLGYKSQFPNETGYTILDDHLPMQDAGVPSIDLIDFYFPDTSNRYWHTQQDTVDKCSPASLTAVGKTLQAVVMEWKG